MLHRVDRRQGERGFALLFVFALAGIAALMLYNELPRAVFESQRAKEDLLVSRGQEYQRGIQLYYRKFRKYPATMEDLEKSNGIRFLRRRYVDPFSGKEDWRLVHVGANGQFTDSKVIKPAQPAQSSGFGANSTSTTELPKEDPNDPAGKRRASDTSAAEIGGNGTGVPANPNDPNALPTGAPPAPTNLPPGVNNGIYPQQQTGGYGGVGAGLPNTSYPSSGVNSQTGGAQGIPIQQPGYSQNQNGQRPLTPEQISPALGVIQDLLTRPRTPPPGVLQPGQSAPGGPITNPSGTFNNSGQFGNGPNTNPSGTFNVSGPAANGGNGQFGGGGIAGVASKHEGKGIKIVNERDRIEEWEFIYDYGKDRGGRPSTNSQSQQAGQGNINPAQGTGFGGQQGSGFGGQQGGFGGSGQRPGGFGQQGGGFGQQGGFQQPRNGRP